MNDDWRKVLDGLKADKDSDTVRKEAVQRVVAAFHEALGEEVIGDAEHDTVVTLSAALSVIEPTIDAVCRVSETDKEAMVMVKGFMDRLCFEANVAISRRRRRGG